MSHFIREFEQLVSEKTSLSAHRVWTLAGMDGSMLSRIRNNDERQSNIQFEDIPRVAAAIGPEALIYLRLLRARLLDQCTTDKRAERIIIEIAGSKIAGGPLASALRDVPLQPPHYESALMNIIAGMKEDTGLRDTILWLGNDVFSPANDPVNFSPKRIEELAVADAFAVADATPSTGRVSYKSKRKVARHSKVKPSSKP